ncbi:MAG: ABC transporter permease [Terriglobia bacterium]
MHTLLQDLRFGLRMLAKNPGFTVVAVLTLALGIGANTAIFNVLGAVLLRPLPAANPRELVLLTDPDSHGRSFGNESGERSLLSFWEFEYLRDHNDVFSSLLAVDSDLPEVPVTARNSVTPDDASEETARVRLVSGGYFSTLGVKAAAGRLFDNDVDRARGGSPFAVISYAYWAQRFGLDPAVVGKTIQVRQTVFEIIGVTPRGFFGETVGQFPDLWVPITMQDTVYPGRDLLTAAPGLSNQYLWLQVMARLKPAVSLQQAKAAINVSFQQFLASSLGGEGTDQQRRKFLAQRIKIVPGARGTSTLRETYGDPLKLLMGLVALVLMIVCANVGNLLLARGAARQREFAIRIALGAGRFRLLRQILAECLLLALLGATVGLVIAQWGDSLLLRMVSEASAGSESIQLELQPGALTVCFTLSVAVFATLLFGLIPALRANQLDVTSTMKNSSTTLTSGVAPRHHSAGRLFVMAQVALSLILLVTAGLFVHSLARLSEVSLGYNRERLLLLRVDAALAGLKGPANLRLHQELLDKFITLPGVRAATLSSNGLFQGSESADDIEVEGYTPKPGDKMNSRMDHVGPAYFSTLGIPLLIGREIGPQDAGSGHRAAVINQTFARVYLAGQNPLGKHVRDTYPGNPGEAEIVGVVADSKSHTLREPARPRIYFPFFNPIWEHTSASYEVRTSRDPESIIRALRAVVNETNPSLSPIRVETMSGLVDQSLGTDRLIMRISSAIGLLAILLAAIGIYGVMAYTVARRTRDTGLRIALGASRGNVLWGILREALLLVCFGTALGLPFALAGTRLLKSLLFGLGAVDGMVISLAMALLAIVAILAGLLPARRATKVDPLVALRYE